MAPDPASRDEFVGDEAEHQVIRDKAARFHGALDLDAYFTVSRAGFFESCVAWDINSPRGVLFLTFWRRRSPELMDCSCGNRFSSLSDCVPFPTPGAPIRITLAALRNLMLGPL